MSKISSNTYTLLYTYTAVTKLFFTQENISKEVMYSYHTICVDYEAKIKAGAGAGRNRAKVTAPAPAKYPGSSWQLRLLLQILGSHAPPHTVQ